MNLYTKGVLFVLFSHLIHYIADELYYHRCTGLVKSIFTWGSPTCRGLQWVSNSIMTNIITIVVKNV